MSTHLNRICASRPGDDGRLYVLELTCAAWSEPVRLAASPENETVTHENGDVVTYQWSNVVLTLPSRDVSGTETFSFQINGVTDIVLPLIRQAQATREIVTATIRTYAYSDLTTVQERFDYESKATAGTTFETSIAATFPEIINKPFPRYRNTPENSPGTVHM
jgi:hypothetical protein